MSEVIYYHSNLQGQSGKKIRFKDALLQGLAEDGGLFVPDKIPVFSTSFLWNLRGKSYAETAFEVLNLWLQHDIPAKVLKKMCEEAYDFALPVEKIPESFWVARLDQGPTASFKDFAARLLARLTHYYLSPGQRLTILTATSGDTGSAVGEAFKGLANTRVLILYPQDEVSPVQKQQLDTIGGNVCTFSMEVKFDDCQAFVKQAFADPDLAFLQFSSANSINIGRVLPQMVYYIYVWLQVSKSPDEEIIFSIPSGNLGNSLGCELARRMGLPVKKIIIGTNENKAFPLLLSQDRYQKISPSIQCISNAMNVGNPSNLARYFTLYGGVLSPLGETLRVPDMESMRKHLAGYYVSDKETRDCMRRYYTQYGLIFEPHTAIGIAAAERDPLSKTLKTVCMATAHPSKFPETVQETLGTSPQASAAVSAMMQRKGEPVRVAGGYEDFKKTMKVHLS